MKKKGCKKVEDGGVVPQGHSLLDMGGAIILRLDEVDSLAELSNTVRMETIGLAVDAAVASERERCVNICCQFPQNLMAEHIAKQIRSGK